MTVTPPLLPTDLAPLLDRLALACEELLLAGLTTASETTRQTLAVAAQEASRRQLLRLASTLRVANEELGRFTRQEPDFSRKRLLFFLNRTWLLARGLSRALLAGDRTSFQRLQRTNTPVNTPRLEVVTLGVSKKIATGAFVAFDFRLRTLAPAALGDTTLPEGTRLTWSTVFPVKPGVELPAEGFLHLPQKQKFNASLFVEKRRIVIENSAVTRDETGPGRIALRDDSRVIAGEVFTDWERFLTWNPAQTLAAVAAHQTSPFDLEVELHDEIVLDDWQIGDSTTRAETGHKVYPIQSQGLNFDAVVSAGTEGEALAAALDAAQTVKKRPPLFALLHFDLCRLVLQPLALFEKQTPLYMMLSTKNIDRSQLLKALKF